MKPFSCFRGYFVDLVNRKSRYAVIVFLGFYFLLCIKISAQQNELIFKRINAQNFSNSMMTCIIQDSYGYMWFGTKDGLNRYDGYENKIYKKRLSDSTSLADNYIYSLYLDSRKRLWVGTTNGLCLYNCDKENFTRYLPDKLNTTTNSVNRVIGIKEDASQNLYAITEIGILYILKNGKLVPIKDLRGYSSIKSFLIDKTGNFWFASVRGITLYNIHNNQVTNIYHYYEQGREKEFTIAHTVCDDDRYVYFGTNSGQLGIVDKKLLRAEILHFTQTPIDAIYNVYIDRAGLLYIAGNTGLFILNKQRKLIGHYYNQADNPYGLSSSSIKCIYKDIQENLWIGAWPGMNLAINGKAFKNYSLYSQTMKLDIKNIQGLRIDSKEDIWLGSYHNGVNVINLSTGKKKLFMPDPKNPYAISPYSVINLFEDSRKNMWIGTYTGYLQRFDPSTERFISHPFNHINNGFKEVKDIRSMVEDKDGNLWFISHGFGLFKFNPVTGKYKYFTRDYNNKDHSLADNWPFHLFLEQDSILWIATPSGVSIFNIYTEKFNNYYHNSSDSNSLSDNFVYSIFGDSNGNIWLGTSFGLNFYDKATRHFYHFYEDNGLPSNQIKSFVEEKPGTIWIGTGNGLSRMHYTYEKGNLKVNFRNYNRSDNLQDILFWENSAAKTKNGELIFGTENGIITFKPSEIVDNTTPPKVYITDLFLFNKKVNIGSSDSILHRQISNTKKITLKFNQKIISFKFVAINYISPENNKYAYRMEGFDKDWNYVGNKREATYTNLDPGNYRFIVKASNNDGIWNEKGTSLEITILPPWWRTWWFKLIIVVLLSSLIIYILIKIFNQLKQLANQTILNERNQLKTLINNIPLNIYIKDTKLRYVVVNNNMIRFLGKTSEKEILNKTDFELYSKELADKFYLEEQKVLTTGIAVINDEIIKTDSKSRLLFLSSTKCQIINLRGETIGLVGIISDISQQKLAQYEIEKQSEELKRYNKILSNANAKLEAHQQQIEKQSKELHSQSKSLQEINDILIAKQQLILQQSEQLKETNEELLLLNATKDRFFSIIAHDLRNPFNVVFGFSEMLLEKLESLPNEKVARYLEMINTSSKAGHNLLENLLQWSRSQTGRISFEPCKLNLLVAVDETLSFLENDAKRKHIKIKQFIDPNLVVFADENMLKTILRNLISNAIKFTNKNGSITFKSAIVNWHVEISISDTGIGIPDDIKSKLFLIDEIITTRGTSNETGTGLGLLLCKEFVEKHNGKIWVNSVAGQGSEFTFTLPMID